MMRFFFIAVIAFACVCPQAHSAGKKPKKQNVPFSDWHVQKAIDKGIKFLWNKQNKDGSWTWEKGDWKKRSKYPLGATPLVAYAFLESGQSPQDPRMEKALQWLAKKECERTYTLGLRCNVWQVADRTTKMKYQKYLKKDAVQLVRSQDNGAYNYPATGDSSNARNRWDNSNSQYGLLGVWAASRENLEIPRQYWQKVWDHWKRTQNPDGGWGYSNKEENKRTRPTMVAGGVASLFVCFDNLSQEQFARCTGGELPPSIKRGLDWFDENFRGSIGGGNSYYYLYGVERVGLACGYKYFGTADWYKLGAKWLLNQQNNDGSWDDKWGHMTGTSFALLFLTRGQNPVLFNKLQYPGNWNNRPRDLAMATRWITGTFERTVNWQIINLNVPVTDWHDAPILYIAGNTMPDFSPEDLGKIRTFVHQGGTILSVAECNHQPFKDGIREVYKKLFPDYELTACPRDHELYNVHFKLGGVPKFYELSNGVRPLAIHTDHDMAMNWQFQRYATGNDFKAAANIAMYVAGSLSNLPHRGTTYWPPKANTKTGKTVKIVRLKHDANWNPEPLAYERLGRLLAKNENINLKRLKPVAIEDLPGTEAKIAAMTGTEELQLTDAQRKAIKKFVNDGGTLVIDAAGGATQFGRYAWREIGKIFGIMSLQELSLSSKLYNLPGHEIKQVRYRPGRARTRSNQPSLNAVMVKDRPAVIFSRFDITGGLVGQPSHTIDGYKPRSAYEIMRNIILTAD